MVCTAPCLAAKKLDWNTSARKQADFNSQEAALGVNGKILSAGWYHKWADNNWGADGNFYLVLSIQGIIQIYILDKNFINYRKNMDKKLLSGNLLGVCFVLLQLQ